MDFKDAYFSVFVRKEDRKWLQFNWNNNRYQFTCPLSGLTSAPRIFMKLMKPALSHLQKLGMIVCCYLEDCIFINTSADELRNSVYYAMLLFNSLGLTINTQKSVLEPTQKIEFLGVILDSVNMAATLTPRRKGMIKSQCLLLLKGGVILRDLSSFIGMTVASDPVVELAPLR